MAGFLTKSRLNRILNGNPRNSLQESSFFLVRLSIANLKILIFYMENPKTEARAAKALTFCTTRRSEKVILAVSYPL